jgi:tRNA pseudouridine55 synthase
VLPVALGEATKLCGRMLDSDKVYEFTIRFGAETSTLDAEGEVVATSERRPSLDEVEAVLGRFTGEIEQVPPIYSALKVGGRRAYDLARAGAEVELQPRRVTIHSLSVRAEPVEALTSSLAEKKKESPSTSSRRTVGEVTLTASVSKGTYIRSLARDIA